MRRDRGAPRPQADTATRSGTESRLEPSQERSFAEGERGLRLTPEAGPSATPLEDTPQGLLAHRIVLHGDSVRFAVSRSSSEGLA
jgi:hypothetical protein